MLTKLAGWQPYQVLVERGLLEEEIVPTISSGTTQEKTTKQAVLGSAQVAEYYYRAALLVTKELRAELYLDKYIDELASEKPSGEVGNVLAKRDRELTLLCIEKLDRCGAYSALLTALLALLREGREARQLYSKAKKYVLQRLPLKVLIGGLGYVLYMKKIYEETVEVCEKALAINPLHAGA